MSKYKMIRAFESGGYLGIEIPNGIASSQEELDILNYEIDSVESINRQRFHEKHNLFKESKS